MPDITLLGPQRRPTLARVVDTLGIAGPFAVVTAGWQEREADDEELLSLLGGRGVNVHLHARWAAVLREEPDYARAAREHRIVLDEMQQLYRIRLGHAMQATYEVARRAEGNPRVRASAVDDALDVLRRIDAVHLDRVRDLGQAFDESWPPNEHEAIAKHRHDVHEVLEQANCLVVAGGHVGDLLHVLRLFDVGANLPGRVIAWSAGAMALTDRVVLFHDHAAQGAAPAEVADTGLGAFHDVIALPHARRRLRTEDAVRMSILARRFPGTRCLVLDDGVTVHLDSGGALPADARIVTADGRISTADEA